MERNQTLKRKISTRDMAIIPIFSVLTAVGAFIKLPIGPVPLSMQTVFVVLSGIILGRKAVYSQLIYVLLGLLGLPVFTSGGGIGYIFTPTFGYLVGFILASYIIGALREKLKTITVLKLFLISFIGLIVIYTAGAGYLYILKNLIMGDAPISLAKAIKFGALVFIPGDTLWCVFAAFLGKRLTKEIPLL